MNWKERGFVVIVVEYKMLESLHFVLDSKLINFSLFHCSWEWSCCCFKSYSI